MCGLIPKGPGSADYHGVRVQGAKSAKIRTLWWIPQRPQPGDSVPGAFAASNVRKISFLAHA
jgi:hypothetical protein